MKEKFISSVILFFILHFSCKEIKVSPKSEPIISIAYVVGSSGTPVYPKPSFSEKVQVTLPINTKVQILQTNIPDPVHLYYKWIRVKLDDMDGYISEEETYGYRNLSLSIFSPINDSNKYHIRANSLRVREYPNVRAKILTNLKEGEEVTILEKGSLHESFDDQVDSWVKIQTKDGLIGFSFGGYLVSLPKLEDSNYKVDVARGYIEIQENTTYYKTPGQNDKPEVMVSNKENKISDLKPGDIVPIKFQAKLDKSVYYFVNAEIAIHNSIRIFYPMQGWVKASEVKPVKDILTYSYETYKSGKPEEILLYNYLKNQKIKLDFRYAEIHLIEGSDFALVKNKQSSTMGESYNIHSLVMINRETKDVRKIQTLLPNDYGEIEFRQYPNLAGTGMPGLYYRLQGRATDEVYIYQITPKGLKETFKTLEGEMYDTTKDIAYDTKVNYDGGQEIWISSKPKNPKYEKHFFYNANRGKFIEKKL